MSLAGLQDLPVELLYKIHLTALSPSFPYISLYFYNTFKNTTHKFKAQYIIAKVTRDSFNSKPWDTFASSYNGHPIAYLSIALRYPLCNRLVFDAIVKEMEFVESIASEIMLGDDQDPTQLEQNRRRRERWRNFHPLIGVPRRLFRDLTAQTATSSFPMSSSDLTSFEPTSYHASWTQRSPPLPFLQHILSKQSTLVPQGHLTLNVDAHEGYALVRAVHAQFIPLVHFLLENGASPMMRDGLAVLVAIRSKDLQMTKMLVERSNLQTAYMGSGPMTREEARAEARKSKRRKMEDRVTVSSEMLKAAIQCDARDIVDYLMNEKGCVPDMSMLKMVKGGKSSRI